MAKKKSPKRILKIVKDYINLLKNSKIKVAKAYLYGSYIKGNYHPDSDIDVAVFLDEKKIDRFDEGLKLMWLRRKIDTRIEPHPFLISDFKNPDPFLEEIIKTGIEIKI